MSSKSKFSLYETPNSKTSPATPKVRPTRGIGKSDYDSPSPLQSSRLSGGSSDCSPRSVTSKPPVERRTPKLATTPDKPSRVVKGLEVNAQTRIGKGSEIQSQLTHAQEDLKKAKAQIAVIEKEKAQAIDELKESQKVAEETNEKLKQALMAQKRAEVDSEIDKIWAVELDQAGIEVAQNKGEEWQIELEAIRNQHALDVSTLVSTSQELQRVRQELAMTCDAKNQALSHADDATKIAEIHAEKAEILSAELTRVKMESSENGKLATELQSEIDSLKQKLEEAKASEEKVMERDACLREELEKVQSLEEKIIEKEASLQKELEKAKGLEDKLVETEASLEREVENTKAFEEKLVEKEASLKQELEKTRNLEEKLMEKEASLKQELVKSRSFEDELEEKEGVIEQLHVELEAGKMAESYAHNYLEEWKTKVRELEMQLDGKQRRLHVADAEIKEMAVVIESLKFELETVKEEKALAMNNEKLAASSVQSLLEQKNKLINELEISKEEEEKSKKAMESLASALHEVSAEAREAKEKLLPSEDKHENYESQIENLRSVLQGTNEKYETMLDDAKHEIDLLANTIEQSNHEFQNSKSEWEQKVHHLRNCIKQSEEENASLGKEVNRLGNLLKQAQEEACASREEGVELKDSLKEVEAEVIYLQETLGETMAESMKMKESLLDKENELQGIIQENEELQSRDASSLQKIEELSKFLEEAIAKKQGEENGEFTDDEKDYDLLTKVIEFSEENGHKREKKPKIELSPQNCEEARKENSNQDTNDLYAEPVQTSDSKAKEDTIKESEDNSVGIELKTWEETKPFETDKVGSKVKGGESFNQVNDISSTENIDDGRTSPSKQQQLKKKKPLLHKFGNLLKKKNGNNQK